MRGVYVTYVADFIGAYVPRCADITTVLSSPKMQGLVI